MQSGLSGSKPGSLTPSPATSNTIHTVLNANFCSANFGKHWIQQRKISWKNETLWIVQVYFKYPGGTPCRAAPVELDHRSPRKSDTQNASKAQQFCGTPFVKADSQGTFQGRFDPVRSVQNTIRSLEGVKMIYFPVRVSPIFPSSFLLCIFMPWVTPLFTGDLASGWEGGALGSWGHFQRRAVIPSQHTAWDICGEHCLSALVALNVKHIDCLKTFSILHYKRINVNIIYSTLL